MEETVSFLKSLLATHGPNYFERLFGPKARNNMLQLGGVDNVAIVLSGRNNQKKIFFDLIRMSILKTFVCER